MHLATAGDSQRQRQLHADRAAQLAFDEIAQRLRNIAGAKLNAKAYGRCQSCGQISSGIAPGARLQFG